MKENINLNEYVKQLQPFADAYVSVRNEKGIDFAQEFSREFIKTVIKNLIEKLPISQKEFADRLGVTKQYITGLKSGRILPSLEMFWIIMFEINLVLPAELKK